MKPFFSKPLIVIAGLACVAIALFATRVMSTSPDNGNPVTAAKAVLRVDGMTCSGCISTIKNSLAGMDGIDDVRVDLASGTAEIVYDSTRQPDAEKMAAAVTASGYQATVLRVLSSQQLQQQTSENRARSKAAIASVAGADISRADFETEMAHATSRYQMAYGADALKGDQGRRLLDNLKTQIAKRLIDERIQLQEIRRTGFSVAPSVVARQYEAFWQERGFVSGAAFEEELRRNGYPPAYFQKRFEDRVVIDSYIDQKVLTTKLNEIEKQQRYADWFANARLMAAVTYYDKDLEQLVQQRSAAGGCGNSCSPK